MSYIVARVVTQDETDQAEHGFQINEVFNHEVRVTNAQDMNLDDEILSFVLGVIAEIDQLEEGQALVIYKEIF